MIISNFAPTPTRTAYAEPPQSSVPPESTDRVNLDSGWADNPVVQGASTVGKNVLLAGGFSAAGAVANALGPVGAVFAAAGSAAVGAYLGLKSDLPGSALERAALGGAMAATGSLAGSLASSAGAPAATTLVSTLATCGAFRGVVEVAAEHNIL